MNIHTSVDSANVCMRCGAKVVESIHTHQCFCLLCGVMSWGETLLGASEFRCDVPDTMREIRCTNGTLHLPWRAFPVPTPGSGGVMLRHGSDTKVVPGRPQPLVFNITPTVRDVMRFEDPSAGGIVYSVSMRVRFENLDAGAVAQYKESALLLSSLRKACSDTSPYAIQAAWTGSSVGELEARSTSAKTERRAKELREKERAREAYRLASPSFEAMIDNLKEEEVEETKKAKRSKKTKTTETASAPPVEAGDFEEWDSDGDDGDGDGDDGDGDGATPSSWPESNDDDGDDSDEEDEEPLGGKVEEGDEEDEESQDDDVDGIRALMVPEMSKLRRIRRPGPKPKPKPMTRRVVAPKPKGPVTSSAFVANMDTLEVSKKTAAHEVENVQKTTRVSFPRKEERNKLWLRLFEGEAFQNKSGGLPPHDAITITVTGTEVKVQFTDERCQYKTWKEITDSATLVRPEDVFSVSVGFIPSRDNLIVVSINGAVVGAAPSHLGGVTPRILTVGSSDSWTASRAVVYGVAVGAVASPNPTAAKTIDDMSRRVASFQDRHALEVSLDLGVMPLEMLAQEFIDTVVRRSLVPLLHASSVIMVRKHGGRNRSARPPVPSPGTGGGRFTPRCGDHDGGALFLGAVNNMATRPSASPGFVGLSTGDVGRGSETLESFVIKGHITLIVMMDGDVCDAGIVEHSQASLDYLEHLNAVLSATTSIKIRAIRAVDKETTQKAQSIDTAGMVDSIASMSLETKYGLVTSPGVLATDNPTITLSALSPQIRKARRRQNSPLAGLDPAIPTSPPTLGPRSFV